MADQEQSFWQILLCRMTALSGRLREVLRPGDIRDSVAFSIAFIGLAAKLAKADGTVTRDEVRAFRSVFHIPPDQEENAGRVFDLCRQDVAGYEAYARSMESMFRKDSGDHDLRADVLDGLFFIAMADGVYHPAEQDFIRTVSGIFGIEQDSPQPPSLQGGVKASVFPPDFSLYASRPE